jgi:hypothetical protein
MTQPVLAKKNVFIETKHWKGFVDVYVDGYHYDRRQPTILTTVPGTKEVIHTATIMVDSMGYLLSCYETFIKDWTEDEGLIQALIKAGLIILTNKRVHINYMDVFICVMGEDLKRAWAEFRKNLVNGTNLGGAHE